ncbi:MAG: bifunctional folylpolyglutamate synthase/dihydrofolate synthase [Desulfovibrionaceae bacterium]|nr:bifunctional folylpolyglutamate synthase/dihydrofolate synthase [Desulfovibrionaceae bacterium]
MDLGLGRMRAFARAFGRAPRFAVVHVVGTNGKGSTSAFLDALARGHGLRCGLYSSPHFISVRERVLVDGAMLSEAEWVDLAGRVQDIAGQIDLTYFEFITCLAVLAFDRAGVDVAVMEAGLGGRFDAVRVLDPDLTLFTAIGLDHLEVLGPGIEDIARDKAGAMARGRQALSGPQDALVMSVLLEAAREVGAELSLAADSKRAASLLEAAPLGLAGPHQLDNARLALAGWLRLARMRGWPVREGACGPALAGTFLPGRFQKVDLEPPLILDAAHNEPGLVALARALDAAGVVPAGVVFACLRDKDLARMLPVVRGLARGPLIVPGLPCERAMEPGVLAGMLGPGARPARDLAQALDMLSGSSGPVLVCGSLYLLAEFYKLHPRFLRRPEQARGAATS